MIDPAPARHSSREPTPAVVAPMRAWRVKLVYCVVAIIVLGHLYDISTRHENWPFSNYPMFAILSPEWQYDDAILVGVTDEPEPREVKLNQADYFAPLPDFHVRWRFYRVEQLHTGRRQTYQALSRDFLKRYNARRAAGEHSGPPLKGIRVYQLKWNHVDPWAKNVKSPDEIVMLFDSLAPATPPLPVTDPTTLHVLLEEGKS